MGFLDGVDRPVETLPTPQQAWEVLRDVVVALKRLTSYDRKMTDLQKAVVNEQIRVLRALMKDLQEG